MIARFLSYGMYPLLLVCVVLATHLLLRAGHDVETSAGVCTLAVVAFVIALERVIPFRRDWNTSRGDLLTDALHMGVTSLVVPGIYLAGQFAILSVASRVSSGSGLELWPTEWPLPLQVFGALVFAELFTYSLHVLEHRVDFWWRFHATHHSVERLYWLNSTRFHPIDALLSYAVVVAPLALLGIPMTTFAFFSSLVAAHAMIQHANIDLRLGPLNWLVSGPELHRWHHSRSFSESMCNFGGALIVWDHVFRTYYRPTEAAAPDELGIGSMPRFPRGYLAQLATPVRWAELKEPED